jgi:hypothetical protein
VSLNNRVKAKVTEALSQEAGDTYQLNNSLRLLSKWRSVLIQNTFLKHHGTTVLQGPLAGLDFIFESSEGCHVAKLLGCYEQPLQPFIEEAIAENYEVILNIGCAEGYYAVGMARRMKNTKVWAFDTSPKAQAICTSLALKGGLQNRVVVGGQFCSEDFPRFSNQKALVLCDIEGSELTLLDPDVSPLLKHMDIIVESHECLVPGITNKLVSRFKASHDIKLIKDDGQRRLKEMPEWFLNLSHLDQLLAVWEWRSGPTPWLVMKARDAEEKAAKR